MSEMQRSDHDPQTQIEQLQDLLPPKQDWVLSNLVNMVNAFEMEIGITLTVGGCLITGSLFGARAYHKAVAEVLNSANPKTENTVSSMNIVADYFTETEKMYVDPDLEAANIFNDPVNYIHLKNCRTYLGGNTVVPSGGGTLWRGRISSVDGFFLGVMKPDK